jgi:hypothetical protein
LSFFDDDDDYTRETAAQPRRSSAGARRSGGGGGGGHYGPEDRQQLLVRRAVAAGVGLLVVILLVVGVKACLDSGNEQAMKDYNSQVTAIAQASDTEVTDQLFKYLTEGNTGQLQSQINQLRLSASDNVKRAEALDVPGDMSKAQQYVILALNLRAAALEQIAAQVPTATSGKGDPTPAVNRIAGQMQQLLASDVIWSQRVVPDIGQAFDNAGIGGQVIPQSRSLNNLAWLTPASVAAALGVSLTASDDGSTGATPTPGTHGHALDSVSVGGTTLEEAPATNRIPGTTPITFDVKFSNGGENNEANVNVTVTVTGTGFKEITAKKTVAQTQAGQPAEVSIPLPTAPPKASPVQITVEVAPVAGEKDASNNKKTYGGVFE